MTESDRSVPVSAFHLRPQWQAWLVAAAAWVALLVCVSCLENAVRSDLRAAIGEEPPSWSEPQVRAYASARSHISSKVRTRLLQRVVQMKPDGIITAAAASDLAVFSSGEENVHHRLLAARAVPADSPLLSVHYGMATSQLVWQNRTTEAIALLYEGLGRATTPTAQRALLCRLLGTTERAQGLSATLRVYAQYERRSPELAHSDTVQEHLACAFEKADRQPEADRIYRYLASHATNLYVRQRAQQKLAPGGRHGD